MNLVGLQPNVIVIETKTSDAEKGLYAMAQRAIHQALMAHPDYPDVVSMLDVFEGDEINGVPVKWVIGRNYLNTISAARMVVTLSAAGWIYEVYVVLDRRFEGEGDRLETGGFTPMMPAAIYISHLSVWPDEPLVRPYVMLHKLSSTPPVFETLDSVVKSVSL